MKTHFSDVLFLTAFLFIILKLETVMANQKELADQLTALGTQLDKVMGEINAEVTKLEDAISNAGSTSPEVDAALASLKSKVQSLDDLNTDVDVTPPADGGVTTP